MTQDDLINQLKALKKDLTNRPNDRAITGIVSRHIHTINECMEYGYSRKDIYDYIFDDNDKNIIKLDYFNNNILYRARKKNRNSTTNNKPGEFNSNLENERNENNHKNVFSSLAKEEKKPIHDPRSSREAADERVKKLLMEKRGILNDKK